MLHPNYQFNREEFKTVAEITGLVGAPPKVRIITEGFVIVNWNNVGISYSWKNNFPNEVEIRNVKNEKITHLTLSELNEKLS